MYRIFNESARGGAFSEETKRAVWNKGQVVPGYNPNYVRKDVCNAWIEWDKYGDVTPGGYGWEIDHIKPVAAGGGDELSNLQPLQWQNNRRKGDDYPAYNFCAVSA